RYAITSVSRYLIVIVGLLTGLSLFGVRWSQLQWMAAALTVGLGFGLQEIFANFVSGLILLFERPFRVGDIITIGDLTGTVTRIRTRATTLVDFDNKEIVVPNKTFITGQLVNWTLSDTRTRIIVKVGVAYGSDPALVHRLLMQAAEEHPKVLAEPAPRSWFMAFGASALEFELRVFVSEIADRLRTLNDLNSRIAELFAEHGIEIAFPQLDIHVRDLPPRADEAPAGG
ncbi:mechanosensitive ion channel domain-containing protein, partial [Rehaibacterium terrae]